MKPLVLTDSRDLIFGYMLCGDELGFKETVTSRAGFLDKSRCGPSSCVACSPYVVLLWGNVRLGCALLALHPVFP